MTTSHKMELLLQMRYLCKTIRVGWWVEFWGDENSGVWNTQVMWQVSMKFQISREIKTDSTSAEAESKEIILSIC